MYVGKAVFIKRILFINQSACYKLNEAEIHCVTGANCRPKQDRQGSFR